MANFFLSIDTFVVKYISTKDLYETYTSYCAETFGGPDQKKPNKK